MTSSPVQRSVEIAVNGMGRDSIKTSGTRFLIASMTLSPFMSPLRLNAGSMSVTTFSGSRPKSHFLKGSRPPAA